MVKKTSKQKLPHYTLHRLIVELSYLGTATRVLLVSFLAIAIGFIRVLEQQSASDISLTATLLNEGQLLIYAIGSFIILDSGYVTIARANPFNSMSDVHILLISEIVLGLFYFLPFLAVVSEQFAATSQWFFVAVLFMLALRLVLGIVFGRPPKK